MLHDWLLRSYDSSKKEEWFVHTNSIYVHFVKSIIEGNPARNYLFRDMSSYIYHTFPHIELCTYQYTHLLDFGQMPTCCWLFIFNDILKNISYSFVKCSNNEWVQYLNWMNGHKRLQLTGIMGVPYHDALTNIGKTVD